VIEAEDGAIAHYNALMYVCGEAHDYVAQNLCITQLADEEGHRVTFAGFFKEYVKRLTENAGSRARSGRLTAW
jgi:bacterioferritin (cytochrome b1)